MKKIILIFGLLITLNSFSQLNIVPMPAEVQSTEKNISFKLPIQIIYDSKKINLNNALYLQKELAKIKCSSVVVSNQKYEISKSQIMLINLDEIKNKEEYVLAVSDKKFIAISGSSNAVFMGLQSFLQLVQQYNLEFNNNNLILPICTIKDYPRFAYRGMHLDVSRHFMPVDFVKKYIDYLAFHKFNTFHWHLTDDQGWRIEIKKYPLLTQVGSCRVQTLVGRYGSTKYDNTKHCGFYTQSQIKEVVQYAADRYITIIPEIEMPGHSDAALASYPYLGCTKGPYKVFESWGIVSDVYCAGNDSTFNFLQNVLDEVIQLFPSKYIHIGGDECPKERWKTCVKCQQRIKTLNLKNENGLQSYFVQRIEKYLNSKGRNIIGWDEILEGGLAPNATVMSWRGEEGGIEAAKQKHDVIMTPGTPVYFDHSQTKNEDSVTIGGYNSLEAVYNYEPIPAALNAEQSKHVLGAQANVWTEYMAYPSKVEYMIFPRMSALSEVLWSPKEKRNWKDFERRLPAIFKWYQNWGANYSKAYFDLDASVLPTSNNDGVLWQVKDKLNLPLTLNVNNTDSVWAYTNPVLIKNSCQYFVNTKNVKLSQKFYFNKATGKKITLLNPPSKSYPGDGAFTLVNGIQNEKRLAKSSEFVGFLGNDLDVTIDLGAITDIKKITLHVLEQPSSWIYAPTKMDAFFSNSTEFDAMPMLGKTIINSVDVPQGKDVSKIEMQTIQRCRYVHIVAKNIGIIPQGNPGAGDKAWLFADEIEIE